MKGLGEAAVTELKIVQAAAGRLARGQVKRREVLSSWTGVLDYCRTTMAFDDTEQFRVLFLDKKNRLIADEVQQTGTVDHTPVYPREVVKRALELTATAVILVHNHPSGDPTPSRADVQMTQAIVEVAQPARHRRARPHHRRQGRTRQPEGAEADLMSSIALQRSGRAHARSGCSEDRFSLPTDHQRTDLRVAFRAKCGEHCNGVVPSQTI